MARAFFIFCFQVVLEKSVCHSVQTSDFISCNGAIV